MSDEDAEVARQNPEGVARDRYVLQLVELPSRPHRDHYEEVSNGCLGLLFHYLFDLQVEPSFDQSFERAWRNYRLINRIFAQTLSSVPDAAPVLVQDFHLMLVGEELRRLQRVDRPLLYFHHVPWCEPEYFNVLPSRVSTDILRGLLAYDVVGFHATSWARAFLDCCERMIPGARSDADRVLWRGRATRVISAAGALDVRSTRAAAHSGAANAWAQRLERMRGDRWMLVRVDRADLWKNLYRGLLAFEGLLARSPGLRSRVWFAVLTTPARSWIPAYRDYFDRCADLIEHINRRFRLEGGAEGPISLLVSPEGRPDRHRALAALRTADALLVNPTLDGLNLVAKEWAAVSERDGVLILSRNAGVYEQLGPGALGVNPFDVTETAAAIERALLMDAGERADRARSLRRIVGDATPERWVEAQLGAVP